MAENNEQKETEIKQENSINPEEEEQIKERLKALGYLD